MKVNTGTSSVVDRFIETWVQQFGRTIEIFNSEKPVITWNKVRELPPSQSSDFLWWKQEFEGSATFVTWIGAHESTWKALGGKSDTADTTDAKETYLEIVNKAQEATAAILSTGVQYPFRCQQGVPDHAPESPQLLYALIGVKASNMELPAIILAIEPAISNALPKGAGSDSRALQTLSRSAVAPMLERLMDLELPLSVSLGRTELPIRDVLRVTAGTVIELNQNVGDYVDLVVHGTIVARGEVVSIKGNYGIRIKEVISRKDRIDLYDRG